MNIESFKLAGEDISKYFRGLTVKQSIGVSHDQFSLRLSREDRAAHFKASLSEVTQKWIGEKLVIDGLFTGVVTSVALSRTHGGVNAYSINKYKTLL